jgi:hypothetical protein
MKLNYFFIIIDEKIVNYFWKLSLILRFLTIFALKGAQ